MSSAAASAYVKLQLVWRSNISIKATLLFVSWTPRDIFASRCNRLTIRPIGQYEPYYPIPAVISSPELPVIVMCVLSPLTFTMMPRSSEHSCLLLSHLSHPSVSHPAPSHLLSSPLLGSHSFTAEMPLALA